MLCGQIIPDDYIILSPLPTYRILQSSNIRLKYMDQRFRFIRRVAEQLLSEVAKKQMLFACFRMNMNDWMFRLKNS
ncbi:hypothetical protein D1872_279120 [compost metagenome]